MQAHAKEKTPITPSITDVDGILVGHFTARGRPTGCTVVTSLAPFSAGVDVRGGAPGTRETDLLKAENTVQMINAIVLAGGSAFGLDAAAGVVRFLEEQGRGFDVRGLKVTVKTAIKASWGTWTLPICFMRFLPSFCFSNNFRLRVMSPP